MQSLLAKGLNDMLNKLKKRDKKIVRLAAERDALLKVCVAQAMCIKELELDLQFKGVDYAPQFEEENKHECE